MSKFLLSLCLPACLMALPPKLSAEPVFQSPTGNIYCYVNSSGKFQIDGSLSCLIFENEWSQSQKAMFQQEEYCGLDQTPMLILHPNDPPETYLACHGDVFWPKEGRFTLPYGETWKSKDFTCKSERTGMVCVNRKKQGFSVARRGFTFLTP